MNVPALRDTIVVAFVRRLAAVHFPPDGRQKLRLWHPPAAILSFSRCDMLRGGLSPGQAGDASRTVAMISDDRRPLAIDKSIGTTLVLVQSGEPLPSHTLKSTEAVCSFAAT